MPFCSDGTRSMPLHPRVCLAGIEPSTPRVTVSCASLYTTDSIHEVGRGTRNAEVKTASHSDFLLPHSEFPLPNW